MPSPRLKGTPVIVTQKLMVSPLNALPKTGRASSTCTGEPDILSYLCIDSNASLTTTED